MSFVHLIFDDIWGFYKNVSVPIYGVKGKSDETPLLILPQLDSDQMT